MEKLPEKFPEYSIMYKTLTNQIKALEQKEKENTQEKEIEEIKLKIQKYESEKTRIKKMFPDNFFERLN